MPANHEKVLEEIYTKVAMLDFGHLLMLSASVNEHIYLCWQNHQLQIEKAREQNLKATRPSEQALPERRN
jgi:hypothetical protein